MPPGRPWAARNSAAIPHNGVRRVPETAWPPISPPTARMPYGPDARSVTARSPRPGSAGGWTEGAPGRPGGGHAGPWTRNTRLRGYFLPLESPSESEDSTAMKASCGTSTLPTIFIRFLPSFCFSSSFRLREMSPP